MHLCSNLQLVLLCIWSQRNTAFQVYQPRIPTTWTQQSALSTTKLSADKADPTLVILVPSNAQNRSSKFGVASLVEPPSMLEAAHHLALKTYFFCDGRLQTHVLTADNYATLTVRDADIVLAYGLEAADELKLAQSMFEARQKTSNGNICQMGIDCAQTLPDLVGPYDAMSKSLFSGIFPWSQVASGRRLHQKMTDYFQRWTTDDFGTAVVLFLNQFVTPIDWVRHNTAATWEKGVVRNAKEFYAMVTKCGDYLGPCLQDESCRTCLTKLTKVDPRDQALSYRTLVSYESELLQKFSLCAFTKHNIFQCDATIPTIPVVQPLAIWRNKPVTDEVARSLLVGHLKGESSALSMSQQLDVSWKVCCGANEAYDQFPSQNQIFYPSSSTNAKLMWYDPVFRVDTLDGRSVWCRRHYRVKQLDENPATFRFSVSDNGVTSDEFWTIVGAADDLSWIVFHYAGAAKAVGLRYLGGLLCTPDGLKPKASDLAAIWTCFKSAGIQPWELYVVDNRLDTPDAQEAGPPPLEFYRQGVMALRQNKKSS